MADNTSQQLLDMWKRQVEEGTQAWLRMMGQAQASTAAPSMGPNMAMDPQAFRHHGVLEIYRGESVHSGIRRSHAA